jgi:hypothetical protein
MDAVLEKKRADAGERNKVHREQNGVSLGWRVPALTCINGPDCEK